MKITVTKEHIKNGERKNPNYCPVAIAIREQVKGASCVEVCESDTPNTITFLIDDDSVEIYASEEVVKFVNSFDAKEKVEPFSFELDIK